MENNTENQTSTEQYYGAVESTTPIKEETSYSLEDLRPKEEVEEKVSPPPVSDTEEIQPDPTVIDGIKAPIGDQSAKEEMLGSQASFSTNRLEPSSMQQPVTPVQQMTQQQPMQQVVQRPVVQTQAAPVQKINKVQAPQQNEDSGVKLFYVVIALIMLGVVVGLPLYSYFSKEQDSQGTSEKLEENKSSENNPKNENTNNPPEPTKRPGSITFDMTLAFDKGLVTNEKEINQKVGYLPTDLTGVVRCDLEKPVVNAGITTYGSTYLYYENYKLKSAISVTKQVYLDQNTYLSTKDSTLIYKNAGDINDSLDVTITQDDQTYTVTNIMQYNLQYGNATYIDELKTSIMFSSHFNTNIKAAIDNLIATSGNSNTVCSTVNTFDTSTTETPEAGI